MKGTAPTLTPTAPAHSNGQDIVAKMVLNALGILLNHNYNHGTDILSNHGTGYRCDIVCLTPTVPVVLHIELLLLIIAIIWYADM